MSDAARLLDGLRRQQDKYREMAAVSAEQSAALEASDMDRLLAAVERKRALLAEIDLLEKGVGPLRSRWDDLKSSVDASLAKEIEEIVVGTREVLQALVKQEDEGRAALERRRQTEAAQLQAMMKKSQARRAYGGDAT